MAETVRMPKLGFDMAEGTLVRWVVNEGEPVSKGAVLAEIETDKATVEVESNYEGIVARHLVNKGDIVPVNSPIAIIASQGEDISAILKSSVPVEAGTEQPPAELKENEVSAEIDAVETPEGAHLPGNLRASPLARRMASAVGLNLSEVRGSGPGGRIVKQDIKEFMTSPGKGIEKATASAAIGSPAAARTETREKTGKTAIPLAPLPLTAAAGDRTVEPSRLRMAIGRRMVESKQQVPHFYVTHEYAVDMLMQLRKQVNEFLPDEQKISVNDFIVKAVALTLRQYPNLNAALKENRVVQFGAINIGVAVAVEGGLLTVVCRDADRKPLRQISSEVRNMAGKAREGKVRPEDIEGSTFSLSNLGMFDVENFSAIINPPEAAILAVSSARQIPVVQNEQVTIGWRMKATISVDHRVSDGAEGARFMQALATYLENPVLLLL